jgi:hypothetical protein
MAAALTAAVACDRQAARSGPSSASVSASALPNASAPSATTPATAGGTPCGALACTQFDSAREAFLAAVAGDPLVIAIGEAHAPKGATAPSATKRFTEELLPALPGRASDLLVELMMPPKGCTDAAAEVRKKQEAVTSRESENNQNEYVVLGDRAHALGIVPDMLRPSCADMDAVRDAGDQAIEASLEMIARLSGAQATRLVDRDARSDADRDKCVVVYGGMLHNDLSPPPERARWTYAPVLDAHVGGRFVAIDLVVPEFIVDDDTWRSLPWYAKYDRARLGSRPTLFKTGDKTFVLIFAEGSH